MHPTAPFNDVVLTVLRTQMVANRLLFRDLVEIMGPFSNISPQIIDPISVGSKGSNRGAHDKIIVIAEN